MKEIGAFDAKSERGKAVAKLVSATRGVDCEQARAATQRIRERAEKLGLGHFDWTEWKAYRDEGRP